MDTEDSNNSNNQDKTDTVNVIKKKRIKKMKLPKQVILPIDFHAEYRANAAAFMAADVQNLEKLKVCRMPKTDFGNIRNPQSSNPNSTPNSGSTSSLRLGFKRMMSKSKIAATPDPPPVPVHDSKANEDQIIVMLDVEEEEEDHGMVENKKKRERKKVTFKNEISFVINVLCKLNLVPAIWDKNECQCRSHTSKFFYRLWFLTVFLTSWLNFLFVLFRFLQGLQTTWKSVRRGNELDFGFLIGLWSSMAFKFCVTLFVHSVYQIPDHGISLVNQLLRWRFKENDPEIKKSSTSCRVMTVLLTLRVCQLIWSGVTKSYRTQFIYSLLPVRYRNYFTFSLYLIFQIYASLSAAILIYCSATALITVETLDRRLKKKFAPNSESSFPEKMAQYRKLEILALEFDDQYGMAYMYLKVYTLVTATICSFGSLRFYDNLDFRIWATMPMSLITLTAFSYCFYGKAGSISSVAGNARKELYASWNLQTSQRDNRVGRRKTMERMMEKNFILANIQRDVFPKIVKFVVIQTIRMLIVASRRR